MSESTPDVATQPGDELLLELADDYLRRYRAGEQPTVDEYVSKHPEFADRIRELFPAMIAMEQPGPGATVDLAPPTERVGAIIGRYKLLERIGEGGFGVVYMAEQQHPVRRKVALKVIKPGMDSRQVLARFEAERQALAIMDHPNIAKVFDAGATDSGRPYFVMELIKGEPITEFCDRNHFSPHQRLELFAQVCHAVQHAHQKGIIHRDIKPTNVLAAMHDTNPVVKVIDFGVAKALGQELTDKTLFTGFAQFLGTPLYMSPEQAGHSALDIDTRSDIYSLGVLLYELLTGTTPFDKERFKNAAQDEIRRIIREEEPPRPSTRLSESKDSLPSISAQRHTEPAKLTKLVRGELDWIVMKALEKDRNWRYETANAFATDVQRYLDDEPVEACPPSAWYRFRKFARRYKAALVAASLVTTLLIAAVAVLSVSNGWVRRESAARAAALKEKDAALQEKVAALKDRDEALELAREKGALERSRYYAAQMNLACQSWKDGEHARTVELLESQRPRLGEPDVRGFEWRHLYHLSHANSLRHRRDHWGMVNDIAWSMDGTLLATGSADGFIRLWDGRGGQFQGDLFAASRSVWDIALSRDGNTLAAAYSNGELVIWDVPTRRERLRWMAHPIVDGAHSVAISPDGRLVASGAQGVKVWDATDGDLLTALRDSNDASGGALAFSPDGMILASAGFPQFDDKSVTLWDVNKAFAQQTVIAGIGGFDLAFSEDGQVLWAADNSTIQTIDVAAGRVRDSLRGHTANVNALAVAPGKQVLVSASDDRTVRLWDIGKGTSTVLGAELAHIRSVAVDPMAQVVVCGDVNGWVTLRTLHAPDVDRSFRSASTIDSIAFSPDSRSLVIGSQSISFLNLATLAARETIDPGMTLAVSRDAKLAAAYDASNRLSIWDIAVSRKVSTAEEGTIDRAVFSPDGKLLAAWEMAEDNELKVINAVSGQVVDRIQITDASVISAAFSPDSRRLALGLLYRDLGLYDLETKSLIQKVSISNDLSSPAFVAYSADGASLAAGMNSGDVALFAVAKGPGHLNLRAHLRGHSLRTTAVAFSPDSAILATASEDGSVRLWDVATGQERITFDMPARLLAFSPDGSMLAVVQNDQVVRLLVASADSSAKLARTWRDKSDPESPDRFISNAFSAWKSGESKGAEEKLQSAILALKTEIGADANVHFVDRLVSCNLHLHLLRTMEGRTDDALHPLLEAKQLLSELPENVKQWIGERFRALGPKFPEKDRLADMLFPPDAQN